MKRIYCNEKKKMRNDFIECLMKDNDIERACSDWCGKILTLLDLSGLSGFLGLWTILCEVTDFPTIVARGPGSGISFGVQNFL